jgi:hypothetical protein
VLVLALLVVGAGPGCRRVLFRADDERTPYARYDRVRQDAPPPTRVNEFGRTVPNLRARLLTADVP